MKKRRILPALFGLSMAVAGASASAAVMVDFTSSAWSGADGRTEFEVGSIRLESTGGPMTFNGPSCGTSSVSPTLACNGDGIGINFTAHNALDDPSEVDPFEMLTVRFLGGPVQVLNVELLNLTRDRIVLVNSLEQFQIRANGVGSWSTFTATTPLATGGYSSTLFTAQDVSFLELRANSNTPLGAGIVQFSDASLARITYEVPVPGTLALLGLGIAGLGLAARRRA